MPIVYLLNLTISYTNSKIHSSINLLRDKTEVLISSPPRGDPWAGPPLRDKKVNMTISLWQ